jgi:hypothetical protein
MSGNLSAASRNLLIAMRCILSAELWHSKYFNAKSHL